MKFLLSSFSFALIALAPMLSEATDHELELHPLVGYGSSSGWNLGADITYAYKLNSNFQVLAGAAIWGEKDNHGRSVHAGFDYNFDEDFKYSFFAGLGAEYTDYEWPEFKDCTQIFGRMGKRIPLGNEGNFIYKPLVQASSYGNTFKVSLMLINFSYLF